MDEYKYECKPKALSDEHSRLSHSEKPRQRNIQSKHLSCGFLLLQLLVGLLVLGSAMLIVIFQHPKALLDVQPNFETAEESVLRASCARTCKFEIAESIPQNLTFNGPLPLSTFDAWKYLIDNAKCSIDIAAYKSSLRGKHVFGCTPQPYSKPGEKIFESLLHAGLTRDVDIRMVENSPSKDKGDNEDGISLEKLGAVTRRTLNLQRMFGSGTMHSKFIVVDNKHFYLGSANLDWRSLNQKMEMGVLVRDCPCLAQDLRNVFEVYWRAAEAKNVSALNAVLRKQQNVIFNTGNPLKLTWKGVNTDLHLATSPKYMNQPGRSWDLDSIVTSLDNAKSFAYIHVMDYFPMFLYGKEQRYWPRIDNAIRAAIMRGVRVKIIGAALHYPTIGLRFLKSLESMNGATGSISVKIFKVPSSESIQNVLRRDRRTHKKFLVTDDTVIIGTSNWSGDYFEDRGTGAAIVIKQDDSNTSTSVIREMKSIFDRDWNSDYVHSLSEYFQNCILAKDHTSVSNLTEYPTIPSYCEGEKDISLFVSSKA